MLKIDAEIEIQENSRGRKEKYPWKTMGCGDSLWFPQTPEDMRPWASKTSMTAWANKKFMDEGKRFVTRKHVDKETGELGARIFRVK